MPASKAQQKAVSKYMKANYDKIKIRIAMGGKEGIQAHAEAHRESVNGFIKTVHSISAPLDCNNVSADVLMYEVCCQISRKIGLPFCGFSQTLRSLF